MRKYLDEFSDVLLNDRNGHLKSYTFLCNYLISNKADKFREEFNKFAADADYLANVHHVFNVIAYYDIPSPEDGEVDFQAHGSCLAIPNEALEIACYFGSVNVLKALLKLNDPGGNVTKLIRLACNGYKEIKSKEHEKCIDLLLEKPGINIRLLDEDEQSVIFYLRDWPQKIPKLLDMGAFFGKRHPQFLPDISFVNPKMLEEHFDKCINLTYIPKFSVKLNKSVEFDLKNFIESGQNEMIALKFIGNSDDYKHLLTHPLVETFVLLKWKQLSPGLHLYFLSYLAFSILTFSSFIAYHEFGCIPIWLKWSTMILNVTMGARNYYLFMGLLWELVKIQSITFNHLKVKKLKTYTCVVINLCIDITKDSLVSLILFNDSMNLLSINSYPKCAIICVVIIIGQLSILAKRIFLPFSQQYIMLRGVAWRSIQSLLLYGVLLPAFALAFYLLQIPTKPGHHDLSKNNISDDQNQANSNNHPTFIHSVMKTIVMSTGEFDYGEKLETFSSNPLFLIVFFTFLFLISIIFMNSMNTHAIGDTNRITADTEFYSLRERCEQLYSLDVSLSVYKNRWFWYVLLYTARCTLLFN